MTRLEFNDVGMVVRHDDMWGLKEALEGIVPLVGLLYPLHRKLVGWIVSKSMQAGWTLNGHAINLVRTILAPAFHAWGVGKGSVQLVRVTAYGAVTKVGQVWGTAKAVARGTWAAITHPFTPPPPLSGSSSPSSGEASCSGVVPPVLPSSSSSSSSSSLVPNHPVDLPGDSTLKEKVDCTKGDNKDNKKVIERYNEASLRRGPRPRAFYVW